jgi:hypothetical protein
MNVPEAQRVETASSRLERQDSINYEGWLISEAVETASSRLERQDAASTMGILFPGNRLSPFARVGKIGSSA